MLTPGSAAEPAPGLAQGETGPVISEREANEQPNFHHTAFAVSVRG